MRQKYDCQLKISTRSLHKTERPSVKVLMPGHVIEAIKQNGSDTVSLSLPFFDKAFPKNKLPNSIGKAKAIPNESLQQVDTYFIGMAYTEKEEQTQRVSSSFGRFVNTNLLPQKIPLNVLEVP